MLLAVLQYTYFYPRLPDRVASHFDGAGRADGWSSKPAFFATNLGITLAMAAMFLSIAWIMKKMPDSAINLPNRAYWLAAERRGATIDYVRSQMEWLGAATIGFMVGLFQLSIEANLGVDRRDAFDRNVAAFRRLHGVLRRLDRALCREMVLGGEVITGRSSTSAATPSTMAPASAPRSS